MQLTPLSKKEILALRVTNPRGRSIDLGKALTLLLKHVGVFFYTDVPSAESVCAKSVALTYDIQ